MKNNSAEVESNQSGIHEDLGLLIDKYKKSAYLKPIQKHNKEAFVELLSVIQECEYLPVIDSCCGTAMSSFKLAERYPERWVIGIDQSAKRLLKQQGSAHKVKLLRANCEDLWRLMVEHGLTAYKHYILYPNPWPKAEHVKRRWHGHPVFPVLPQISAAIEVRSNWELYVQEFAFAWKQLTGVTGTVSSFHATEPVTLFEKKYHNSGHALYCFTAG